ncbi:MAG: hypothetical protein ABIN58_09600 [candidate division WOR-3 bacterium]
MKPKKVTEEEWDKEVKRLEERYKVNRFSSSGKPPYGLDVPGFWWIVYGDDVRHLSRKDCSGRLGEVLCQGEECSHQKVRILFP